MNIIENNVSIDRDTTGGMDRMSFNKFITCAEDLVTTHEATRAGFLGIALEKNRVSDPFVKLPGRLRPWYPDWRNRRIC